MKNRSSIARYRALQNGYVFSYKRDTFPALMELGERVLCRRYKRAGEALFSACFTEEVGKGVPQTFNTKHVVENVFYSSLGELNKLCSRKEYYFCNAQLFLKYKDKICEETENGSKLQDNLARDFLFESIYLLQEFSWFNKNSPTDFGVGKANQSWVRDVFANSRCLSWTGYSNEINFGAATIRLAIENRIRSAFGIYGLRNTRTNDTRPIKMSKIISTMKCVESDIDMAVSIDILSKIYSWSNNYIHLLYRSYPWLVLFAHDAIAPLFNISKHTGRIGPNYTIKTSKATINFVRDISNYTDDMDPNWQIAGPKIEDCAVGIVV